MRNFLKIRPPGENLKSAPGHEHSIMRDLTSLVLTYVGHYNDKTLTKDGRKIFEKLFENSPPPGENLKSAPGHEHSIMRDLTSLVLTYVGPYNDKTLTKQGRKVFEELFENPRPPLEKILDPRLDMSIAFGVRGKSSRNFLKISPPPRENPRSAPGHEHSI